MNRNFFWMLFSRHKASLWSIVGFTIVINLLVLAPSIYMLQVYDRVLSSGNVYTLLMLTLLFILMLLIMGSLEYLRSQIVIRLSNQLDMQFNQRIYTAAYLKALAQGQMSRTGNILSDFSTVRQFVTGNGLFTLLDMPWFFIYLAIMLLFNIWLGVLAFMGALILIFLAVANEYLTQHHLAQAEQHSQQANFLANSDLQNAQVMAAMGMISALQQRWLQQHLTALISQSHASERAALLMSTTKTLRICLQSFVLGLGALLVIYQQITPGMMIAASILMGRTLAPIEKLIGAWKGWQATSRAKSRLITLLEQYPVPQVTLQLPPPQGEITVEQVTVKFAEQAEQPPVLDNISFHLPAGEVLGIIGASGSGKSTLCRLLAGIGPISTGKVKLDQADIKQWQAEKLGPAIGYLPQDVQLFYGTIAENIARFNQLDAEAVIAAAQKAGVHQMILNLPQGYDTIIGPGGLGLSGGQSQRIGLARALYSNPSLVILDEPNAHLDDIGERLLYTAIEQLRSDGKTVVVITHRMGLLKQTTKLLLLMQGKIHRFGDTQQILQSLQPNALKPSVNAAITGAKQ